MKTTELLDLFGAKARCHGTQAKANRVWWALRDRLTEKEKRSLAIARSHFLTGEGPEELDARVKELRGKYGKKEGE